MRPAGDFAAMGGPQRHGDLGRRYRTKAPRMRTSRWISAMRTAHAGTCGQSARRCHSVVIVVEEGR